jgi:hypothetical protein
MASGGEWARRNRFSEPQTMTWRYQLQCALDGTTVPIIQGDTVGLAAG